MTGGIEKIDVIAADVVLSQTDDGGHQRSLTVMVGRMFSHRAGQLGHFDLLLVVSFDAREEHFPLSGLQTVHQTGNGALVVQITEQHQLFVHEITIIDLLRKIELQDYQFISM